MAVDGAQLTVLISPFVPNAHAVVLQILHVRTALQEPKQFVDDGFQMQFLCGEEWKTFL